MPKNFLEPITIRILGPQKQQLRLRFYFVFIFILYDMEPSAAINMVTKYDASNHIDVVWVMLQ